MTNQFEATALVRITVEVRLSQPWCAEEKVGYIHERAGNQAKDRLAVLFSREPDVRIVSAPVVTQVLVGAKEL